jgi:hypothetical protein
VTVQGRQCFVEESSDSGKAGGNDMETKNWKRKESKRRYKQKIGSEKKQTKICSFVPLKQGKRKWNGSSLRFTLKRNKFCLARPEPSLNRKKYVLFLSTVLIFAKFYSIRIHPSSSPCFYSRTLFICNMSLPQKDKLSHLPLSPLALCVCRTVWPWSRPLCSWPWVSSTSTLSV